MFVSRKRRILNQIRNFVIILFLCWCYLRSLADNAKPVESVTMPHVDDRPKFFAVKESTERFIKSTTRVLQTSSDARHTDVERHTVTDVVESSRVVTKKQIDTKPAIVALEDDIMELYIKPALSKATSAFGFNSTASDQKGLLPNTSESQCTPRNKSGDLPTASIIITFYNEHWTTLWVCWFLITVFLTLNREWIM